MANWPNPPAESGEQKGCGGRKKYESLIQAVPRSPVIICFLMWALAISFGYIHEFSAASHSIIELNTGGRGRIARENDLASVKQEEPWQSR